MGERGGKNDMDRVGLFQEMGYITINDRYKKPGSGMYSEMSYDMKDKSCKIGDGFCLFYLSRYFSLSKSNWMDERSKD